MKSFSDYISQSESVSSIDDYIKENIDSENLVWKIQIYFRGKDKQYKEFVKLTKLFSEKHILEQEDVDNFIEKSGINIKKFLDFIMEDIENDTMDYMYILQKVLQNILDDKTVTL